MEVCCFDICDFCFSSLIDGDIFFRFLSESGECLTLVLLILKLFKSNYSIIHNLSNINYSFLNYLMINKMIKENY